jgi:small subunit ribosomal protein S7
MGAKSFTVSRTALKPDPVHGSMVVAKVINCMIYDGKKATAQRVCYDAMDIVGTKIKDMKLIEVFDAAINNVKPSIET